MTEIHWIDPFVLGRFTIMARPQAGDWLEDEIAECKAQGVDVVVSLLEMEEVTELGLRREAELCRANGLEFVGSLYRIVACRYLGAKRRN